MNAPIILASAGIRPEIAVGAIPQDERVWLPQADDFWFRFVNQRQPTRRRYAPRGKEWLWAWTS